MAESIREKDYNTPYDDAFRTMLSKCTRLIIPVINELFGENYSGSEQIVQTPNEYYVSVGNGEDRKIVTDSVFTIIGVLKRRYHLECQSSTDGSILIRIFEYDVHAALEYAEIDGDRMRVRLPHSGILYLRSSDKTPRISTIMIEASEGEVEHRVHSMMVKEYTVEEIFSKNLLFLIPFHIFAYEKRLDHIDSDAAECESLTEHYAGIIDRIEKLAEEGSITAYERQIILELSWKVFNAVTKRHDNVRKAGKEVMGGRVLELEADKLLDQYNKGVETGTELGKEIGKEIGKEEERDESARIFAYLKVAGRLDEYERALRDKDLWDQLLQEVQK